MIGLLEKAKGKAQKVKGKSGFSQSGKGGAKTAKDRFAILASSRLCEKPFGLLTSYRQSPQSLGVLGTPLNQPRVIPLGRHIAF